jgi:hypothetical protein
MGGRRSGWWYPWLFNWGMTLLFGFISVDLSFRHPGRIVNCINIVTAEDIGICTRQYPWQEQNMYSLKRTKGHHVLIIEHMSSQHTRPIIHHTIIYYSQSQPWHQNTQQESHNPIAHPCLSLRSRKCLNKAFSSSTR